MSDIASSPAVVDPQSSAKQERASWPAVFSLAFGAFGLVTAELLPVSILTPMATELDASNGEVGQAVTATAIIAAFAFGGIPVSASIWNARAAPDLAESAGALLASSFQVAIASGAFIGGILIDDIGPRGVIVYACTAVVIGAVMMLTLGRAAERKRAAMAMQREG